MFFYVVKGSQNVVLVARLRRKISVWERLRLLSNSSVLAREKIKQVEKSEHHSILIVVYPPKHKHVVCCPLQGRHVWLFPKYFLLFSAPVHTAHVYDATSAG